MKSWSGEQQQSDKDLSVDSADIFAKTDLDLGKCNTIKHAIEITDPQPFKERYRRIPPHLFDEVKKHLQEMIGGGGNQEKLQSLGQCCGAGKKERIGVYE